ncbi:Papilin, partial [Araneus ventricosus]
KYYFNHEEGKCKKFIYGGCKGNGNNFDSIEECERSCLRSAEDASSEPICAEDGVRPDFESCGRYIRCSKGEKEMVSCPPGLHFNEASKQCDSPCDARCDTSLAMECEWPMGAEKTADPECAEDGRFTDFSSCSRYINCSNGEKSVESCPSGLHFNEKTKHCDSPCDAHCDQSLAFRCGWPMGTALSGDNPCPENEHLSLSGAACQRNCKNYKDWIVPCPLIWRRGCICDKGYVRNSEGKCIPTDECETDKE